MRYTAWRLRAIRWHFPPARCILQTCRNVNRVECVLRSGVFVCLQTEARAVSAAHRQVLVKVVCNYRRTDDLNPGMRYVWGLRLK